MRNIRQYISQSWQILKQNRLYSFFYILGTVLAISMIMVLAIGYNLKVGNIYPEVNRDRVLILSILMETTESGGNQDISIGGLSNDFIKALTADVEGIEALCIHSRVRNLDVQKNASSDMKRKRVAYYNEDVWRVYQFDFIDGRPFTREDVESIRSLAVISATTAKSLFGDESAVGEKIWIDYKEFTISGVVKDVSPLAYKSYADIYLPYTHSSGWNDNTSKLGSFSALILAKSSKDFDRIKAQIGENLAKTNSTLDEGVELSLSGGPFSFVEDSLAAAVGGTDKADAASKHILQLLLVVLVIILVPTFNISGIISTEMEGREAEVGIRKAFGAPRGRLLFNLINENLLLSLIGGFLGLLFSYLFIYLGYKWFLGFFVTNSSTLPWLNIGMLINYKVIIIALVSCLLINLLSSIIPQYFSTKKNIITLLKRNSNVRTGKSRKVKSMWIFLELLVVFVVTWMAIDPLYVLNYQKSIYDGFEHENLYTVDISSMSKKSPIYKEETEEEAIGYNKILLDIIKEHPMVDNAVIGLDLLTTPSRNRSQTISRSGSSEDSTRITANILVIPTDKNYFSVQGLRVPERLDEANFRAGSVLISKSVADELYEKEDLVGEMIEQGRVIGVIDDVKTMQYKQPEPTVIMISDVWDSSRSSFLIKSKLGISEGEFIKAFTEDLADKFKMGNKYFDGIEPYSEKIESSNSRITEQKGIYSILVYFVLFNMFLGIFATFWMHSKKRRAEIGLRMAVGSNKGRVSRMFVLESIKMASIAALVGLLVVGNIVYFKGMFTYGEWQSPTYWPVTNTAAHFLIVSLIAYIVIILIVTLGTLIPASKAANTNPVDALRDE